jgi:hypothetical protein
LTFLCVFTRIKRKNEEVNGKWLRNGKERGMKKDISKEINKVQKSPACIATDIASCLMVEVREQNWFSISMFQHVYI